MYYIQDANPEAPVDSPDAVPRACTVWEAGKFARKVGLDSFAHFQNEMCQYSTLQTTKLALNTARAAFPRLTIT